MERNGAGWVRGEHLEYVLAELSDHRVTIVFQKYGDGQGRDLALLARCKPWITVEHNSEGLEDEGEDPRFSRPQVQPLVHNTRTLQIATIKIK